MNGCSTNKGTEVIIVLHRCDDRSGSENFYGCEVVKQCLVEINVLKYNLRFRCVPGHANEHKKNEN